MPQVPRLNLAALEQARTLVGSQRGPGSGRSATTSGSESSRTPSTRPSSAASNSESRFVPMRTLQRAAAMPTLEALLQPEASVGTPRSDRSTGSAVYAYHDRQHDEALERVAHRLPAVIRAMVSEIAMIYARSEAPQHGAEGRHTPLWRDKVVNLDESLMERLLPLTVARALLNHDTCPTGAVQIFEAFADHPSDAQLAIGLRNVALYAALETLSTVHGSANLQRVMLHGLQTRDWRDARGLGQDYINRVKDAANTLLEVLGQLPAATVNALTRAALNGFERR